MRDRFPLLVLGGLLLFGVLGALLVRSSARGSFADKLSSYRAEPDGARALYLLAEESGLTVARTRQSFDLVEPDTVPILLGVETSASLPALGSSSDQGEEAAHEGLNWARAQQLSASEQEALLAHLEQGGRALYVPWSSTSDALLARLETSLHPPRADAPGAKDAKDDDAAAKDATQDAQSDEVQELVPAVPSRYTRGVQQVRSRVRAHLVLPALALPLLEEASSREVVAAAIPHGKGTLVVITAPELAMNRALARADNAQLWLSVLSELTGGNRERGGRIAAFDEFHHGFTNNRSVAEFAFRYGLHFAAGQLLLGLGLWALALRRFGRAKLPVEETRESGADALFATARLYREGRHHAHAATLLSRALAHELAPLGHVRPGSSPAEVAKGLALAGRTELARSLEALDQRAQSASHERDVLAIGMKAADLRLLARRPAADG